MSEPTLAEWRARAMAAEKERDELLKTFQNLQLNPIGFGDAIAHIEKVKRERDLQRREEL